MKTKTDTAPPMLDVTNTVSLGDARAVADTVDRMLRGRFDAAFDRDLLRSTFAAVGDLYAGKRAGYLECDMPYHDLRHSLGTALVMARLIDGYQSEHAGGPDALPADYGLLGVVLALHHDAGFIRRSSEGSLCGPHFMGQHESRSAELARAYLRTTSLAAYADEVAPLILVTKGDADFEHLFDGHAPCAITVGRMLGSADLLSQMADRSYLERCYYHLYPEIVLGQSDRIRTAAGEEVLYRDAFDLVSKTRWFYENHVRKRLTEDFRDVARHLRAHFGGDDPYAKSIEANLDRCDRIVADGTPRLLGPEPATTTAHLAAIYRAQPARA